MKKIVITGISLAALLSGCTVGPEYKRPETKVSAAFAVPATQPATQPSVTLQQVEPIKAWWTTFHDEKLDSLIARAVGANLDLQIAQQRIVQARAQRGIIAADLYPDINATGAASRSRPGPTGPHNLFRAGFDASWEIDVFGGVRRNVEAANADIQTAVENHRLTLVTLLSDVASNYVQLRGSQQQLEIARKNLVVQQHSAEVTRKRLVGGLAGGLDVANAEAQVASTQSQIPNFESQVQQSIYTLSVLLGMEPAALEKELATVAPIPVTPPTIPVGLPSELLRRRPDIRSAESQVKAANARIGVATADLYPRFFLTGSAGLESSQIKSFLNIDNRYWSIGPNFSWPIFAGGRIKANIQVQDALTQQALLQYHKTILTALQDVDSSLVAYAKEQQRRQSLTEAVAANRKAVDLANRLYTQGLTNFLNVLDAQRSLYITEDALVQSDRNVTLNLVSLYKALGGGWEGLDQNPDVSVK